MHGLILYLWYDKHSTMILVNCNELRIDGWVKEDNIDSLLQRNSSGFTFDIKAKTIEEFGKFIDTYNYKDGITNRKIAEEKLSANIMLTQFKEIFNEFSILT